MGTCQHMGYAGGTCSACQKAAPKRTHLTFTEAMEALEPGKHATADENTGWVYFVNNRELYARQKHPRLDEAVRVEFATPMLHWHWHIVEDKPRKSRVREMAEGYAGPGVDVDKLEERFSRVVRDVAEWVDEASTGVVSRSCIRREFLEPR